MEQQDELLRLRHPLPHSFSTPSLALVMYQKFVMGLPFTWQEKGLVLAWAHPAANRHGELEPSVVARNGELQPVYWRIYEKLVL